MTDHKNDNVMNWLSEIINDQDNWHKRYSNSEVKTLAENAKKIIETQHEIYNQFVHVIEMQIDERNKLTNAMSKLYDIDQ